MSIYAAIVYVTPPKPRADGLGDGQITFWGHPDCPDFKSRKLDLLTKVQEISPGGDSQILHKGTGMAIFLSALFRHASEALEGPVQILEIYVDPGTLSQWTITGIVPLQSPAEA